jgi:hypothetical protein
VCRFRSFVDVRCFALSGRCVVVFEDNMLCVLEKRSESQISWYALLRLHVTWLASDCSVFDGDDEVVVVAGTIVGVQTIIYLKKKKSFFLI